MQPPAKMRKRLWVDSPFQSRLLFRLAIYLVAYSLAVWYFGYLQAVLIVHPGSEAPAGTQAQYGDYVRAQLPLLWALVVTSPLLLYNLLAFSNRIAGPLHRCKRMMREMAAGKPVPLFVPRQGDFMGDLFDAFNDLIKEWNARLAAQPGKAAPGEACQQEPQKSEDLVLQRS